MSLQRRVNGVFRRTERLFRRVDGVFRGAERAHTRVSGVWRQFFTPLRRNIIINHHLNNATTPIFAEVRTGLSGTQLIVSNVWFPVHTGYSATFRDPPGWTVVSGIAANQTHWSSGILPINRAPNISISNMPSNDIVLRCDWTRA